MMNDYTGDSFQESSEPLSRTLESSQPKKRFPTNLDSSLDQDIYQSMVTLYYPRNPDRTYSTDAAKKGLLEKLFAPMNPGSIRGSTLVMMSTMIGIGDLSLPYAITQSGLGTGIFFLIIGALLTIWSFECISGVSFRRGIFKYSDLVYDVLGSALGKAFEIILIFYLFGTIFNCQNISSHFIKEELIEVFGVSRETTDQIWFKPAQVLTTNCMLYWMARQRDFYALRYLTIVTVSVIIYVTMVVVFQANSYISYSFDYSKLDWFLWSPGVLSAFNVIAFAFNAQFALLPVKAELVNPAGYRMRKIIERSVFFVFLIYSTLGLVGYISLFTFQDGNFPQVIPDRKPLPNHSDLVMQIARVLLCFNVLFGICIKLNPARLQCHVFFKIPINDKNNEMLTFILLFGSAGLTIFFDNIYAALTIIGGFGSVMTGYLYPGLIYFQASEKKYGWKALGSLVLAIVSSVFGLIPAITTFLSTVGVPGLPNFD